MLRSLRPQIDPAPTDGHYFLAFIHSATFTNSNRRAVIANASHMSNNIHMPIAISNLTQKLVNANEVANGLECNCHCSKCNENLIAVNREVKQRPHFRHNKNSNCDFNQNYESYLHWLTKEIFKNIGKISLPPIRSNDLQHDFRIALQNGAEIKIAADDIADVDLYQYDDVDNFVRFSPRNILLQKVSIFKIESCSLEKTYKSKFGDVRVDIVASVGKNELFIEPFYLNMIDAEKLMKIINLDVSTISINLLQFIDQKQFLFTIEEITDFLRNDIQSKKWIFIRHSKAKNLINNFLSKVWPNQEKEIKDTIRMNAELHEQIMRNEQTIISLKKENAELKSAIKELNLEEIIKNKHWL
jgi:hypothetical protein